MRDLTERRQIELNPRSSEELYHSLVENLPVCVFRKDLDGRFTFANELFCATLAKPAQEILGKTDFDLYPPDLAAKYRNDDRQIIESGKGIEIEEENRVQDGQTSCVHVIKTLLQGLDGKTAGIQCVFWDITERKQAEAALVQQVRLHSLSASVGTALVQKASVREILRDCAQAVVTHLDAAFARVWTLHEEENVLELQASAGLYTHTDGPHGRVRVGEFKIGLIAQERQPHLTNSVVGDPRVGDQEWAKREGMVAFAGFPLLVEGRVVGVLALFARQPLPDTTLTVLGFVADAIALGIERKRKEESLLQSERRFSTVFRASPAAMSMNTVSGVLIDANDQYCEFFGYSREELVGRRVGDLKLWANPEDRESVIERLLRDRSIRNLEAEYRLRSGEVRDVLVSMELVDLANEKELVMISMFTDVTARKHSEAAIRDQAKLLDLAQDAIIVCDLEDRVSFWNMGAERLYGWSADEARGRRVTDLYQKETSVLEKTKAILLERGDWNGDLRHVTKNGAELIVKSRMTQVYDDRGKAQSVLVINTDVSEAKKLEEQFLRAQRIESIGTLASGIAHDLNNILAPISMAMEILSRRSLPPETKKILKIVEANVRRGADIVKQVLTFGRGMKGEHIPTQLKHVIKEIVKIAHETFPKNIRIECETPPNLWVVEGDPTQLHQVLLNLSVNARDAMPEGGKLLIKAGNFEIDEYYASMTPRAKPGPYVVVEVSDAGSGIPPDIIEKIFDPFFTTKEPGKGTGLGLSTVMGIAKGHGGFIQVYSERGKGSTLKIFFPATPDASEMKVRSGKTALLGGKGETILVVDDEPDIRELAETILAGHGYKVLVAEEGTEGVAVFAQRRGEIKAVITDIMMPNMDGLALARSLRRIDPNVRIIASSGLPGGFGPESKIAELQSLGIREFLQKPYTTEKLLTTLYEVLGKG